MASNKAVALIVGKELPPPLTGAIVELATAIMALNVALMKLMEPEEVARADYKN